MVEMRSQLAIERAGLVTLYLQPARRSSIPTIDRSMSEIAWLHQLWDGATPQRHDGTPIHDHQDHKHNHAQWLKGLKFRVKARVRDA